MTTEESTTEAASTETSGNPTVTGRVIEKNSAGAVLEFPAPEGTFKVVVPEGTPGIEDAEVGDDASVGCEVKSITDEDHGRAHVVVAGVEFFVKPAALDA